MTTPSPSQCISQYLKVRSYIETETKAFNERMKAYTDALEKLESYMASVALSEVGPSGKWSLATPAGTAFRKLQTSVKVADREVWMDFLFDGRREGFITNHVPKDAVSEYIEQFDTQPPGLDITTLYRIQFNSPRNGA